MKEFKEIITFWFEEITPAYWWKKDLDFDTLIKGRFFHWHLAARQNEIFEWRKQPEGRLAEIIILDQFSRNMFRDLPASFAFDAHALCLAQEAVSLGCCEQLDSQKVPFLLMPYMHSESLLIHEQAVPLFEQFAPGNLDFEYKHKVIIERFGRYPHRNIILGRESSEEELEFLKQANSSF